MLQLPADVIRLIGESIPLYRRSLRASCSRMKILFPVNKLAPVKTDILDLCKAGELKVLQLYAVNRFRYDPEFRHKMCRYTVACGHLDVIKWFYTQKIMVDFSEQLTENAAARQHFALLEWLISMGCPFGCSVYRFLAEANQVVLLRFLVTEFQPEVGTCGIFGGASRGGHQHIFEEFKSSITEWDSTWINNAVEYGHLELAKWLYSNGCLFDEHTFNRAVDSNDLEILIWLRNSGCVWNQRVTSMAAWRGYLPILKWAVANGCPLNNCAIIDAAAQGHIEIVEWLHQQGFELTVDITRMTAVCGQLECLQWLRAHGCPWDKSICHRAVARGHLTVLKWARANGCPWNRQRCLGKIIPPEMRAWILSQPE